MLVFLHPQNGVVAHLVEHLVRNQKVVGSSPIYSTKKENTNGFSFFVSWMGQRVVGCRPSRRRTTSPIYSTKEVKNLFFVAGTQTLYSFGSGLPPQGRQPSSRVPSTPQKKENTNGFSFFVDSYDRLVEDGVEFGVVPVGHATELILIVFLA